MGDTLRSISLPCGKLRNFPKELGRSYGFQWDNVREMVLLYVLSQEVGFLAIVFSIIKNFSIMVHV